MDIIARYTTPTIIYKPKAVDATDIDEIYLTIKQNNVLIKKSLSDATITDGSFFWTLSQADTKNLSVKYQAILQVDYKTTDSFRYTTVPQKYTVVESGVDKVI